MPKRTLWFAGLCTVSALSGCASTWEQVSAKSFREAPWKSIVQNEDPMTVLRTKVDGTKRAEAMRRLKEPAQNGENAQVQEEALQVLGVAATTNPSPVVRTAAIDALGRFQDPRAVKLLIAAYHKADGTPNSPDGDADGVQQAGAMDFKNPASVLGPVGFEPSFISTLRSRTATALSQTNSPEAVHFLSEVATAKPKAMEDPSERDVRASAIRGLGQMRSKEAVLALANVLKAESGRDVVLTQNAHEGLMNLTGKSLPADPEKWSAVVQAGVDVAPAPNAVQRAIAVVGFK